MDFEERARQHDEALARAHQLRQVAIAQAWDWLLGQVLRPAPDAARAQRRLSHRLERHASTTTQAPTCPS